MSNGLGCGNNWSFYCEQKKICPAVPDICPATVIRFQKTAGFLPQDQTTPQKAAVKVCSEAKNIFPF